MPRRPGHQEGAPREGARSRNEPAPVIPPDRSPPVRLSAADLARYRRYLVSEWEAEALKTAADAAGVSLVLNARVDVFVRRTGTPEEQLAQGLRRARLYRQAGADCIHPISLSDEGMLSEFVGAVGVVNVNVRHDGPSSLARAASLGVRRMSYATSIFREAMAAVEKIAATVSAERQGFD